jgi:hypothetical protein
MGIESVFSCGWSDCLGPCVITFVVTLIGLTIIHLFIYRQLVKLAKERYGIEGFAQFARQQRYLFNGKFNYM